MSNEVFLLPRMLPQKQPRNLRYHSFFDLARYYSVWLRPYHKRRVQPWKLELGQGSRQSSLDYPTQGEPKSDSRILWSFSFAAMYQIDKGPTNGCIWGGFRRDRAFPKADWWTRSKFTVLKRFNSNWENLDQERFSKNRFAALLEAWYGQGSPGASSTLQILDPHWLASFRPIRRPVPDRLASSPPDWPDFLANQFQIWPISHKIGFETDWPDLRLIGQNL